MRILFLGDVMGRSGREAVYQHLPDLRERLALDFVIVNAENAAHGFGLTERICNELFQAGADAITGGNHTWDRTEIIPVLEQERRLLRPLNLPRGTPGRGTAVFALPDGRRIKVVNLMCRLFMELLDCPFQALDAELPPGPPRGNGFAAIVVDVHGEATSEKMALAHIADGRASLVVGTHTHVPTADAHVMSKGTAYQTDAGMCGDYDSVIGMQKEAPINRFLRKMPTERMLPAEGEGTLCGTFVETVDTTGLAARVEPVRLGGILSPALPNR